ncbi:hypothetical protein E3T26_14975 [Cryobacterium sp. TMT1-21]|uniref:Uncharacterized protein n=1 Tax=Cryobacterium shii TaxID=1259235 RepID=A0AAQ2C9B1_9MICO|nr:hypothetical protein E3O49_00150 [Cryobacterium shii]TFC84385.1 hypothetical protein E3T24_10345 [Cryobacterium sp. TmT2-59]TFD08686.1 hypothetical protein E3T26_14975 [Cryobacterium sp. TMT1-21]TFD18477.1 hypothetical protein E3T42_05700 [Cryobacterium sp. TMT4-10]TFD26260.1 hypothetical protein E3T32_03010 [Cryobacterium sp. TMT2-23]TFD40514.1 hypothetical protein E3T37_05590 [Cryobacterium sp. TMT2-10]
MLVLAPAPRRDAGAGHHLRLHDHGHGDHRDPVLRPGRGRCRPVLVSDSLLALNKFVPDAGIWESGFLVMLSYIAAQCLIVLGVARAGESECQP